MLIEQLPPLDDLKARIRFDEEQGRIWLDEQRMLLLHATAFGTLRDELIQSLGQGQAKAVLMRMGFESGRCDARLARQIRMHSSISDAFAVGPQLHTLEGIVRVDPIRLEMDVASGRFHGEFLWLNSMEAGEHLRSHGLSPEPVCWNQIGYACGYTTEFMGKPIFYKEVECIGCGADKCRILGKPLDEWEDRDELARYFEPIRIAENLLTLQEQIHGLRHAIGEMEASTEIACRSEAMQDALGLLEKAAESDVTALLLGETGVGKETFARALHVASKRSKGPFVAVNCAALPRDLVEAELFGVERGAFTGADRSRPGRFERAHGGTLLLDELGELSPAAQTKLLRVLQSGEFERVGDTRTRQVNVRLIAATNANLQQLVDAGQFRADLLYRINVFPITIPPLRERLEDFPELVAMFVREFNAKYQKRVRCDLPAVVEHLKSFPWPGNVRELRNVIERGIILSDFDGAIDPSLFFPSLQGGASAPSGPNGPPEGATDLASRVLEDRMSLDALEKSVLQAALLSSNGNVAEAARRLAMTAPQFRYRLKKHAIA